MDDVTTAVTLVTLDDPDLVEDWFATIGETYDEVADSEDVWADFADRFPTAAESSFGSTTATQWVEGVEDLTTEPAGLLEELASRRDELAAIYWAALQEGDEVAVEAPAEADEAADESAYAAVEEPVADEAPDESAYAAVEEPAADPFAWVHAQPGLAARVEATLQYRPEHYGSHLAPYLEQLWGPGWEQHPDEHKQAWLDQALSGLETTADVAASDTAEADTAVGTEGTEGAEAEEAAELAEVEQQVSEALAEALAEVPEAAALSDEEIAEVLAEVLAEQSATENV